MFLVLYLVLILFKFLQAALVWNTEGEASLFVAIAVPIDLPRKEVFLSYNFMASYRLPRSWFKRPPIFRNGNGTNANWDDENDVNHHDVDNIYDYYDDFDGHEHNHEHRPLKPSKNKHKKPKPTKNKNKKKKKTKTKPNTGHQHRKKHKHKPHPTPSTNDDDDDEDNDYKDFFEGFPVDGNGDPVPRHRTERSLLSRTKFYELLSHRFEQHDFGSGDSCLLRLICESNSYQLAEINGLLGNLIHIMFSPSSSRYEHLPERYYKAEMHGQREGNCMAYHRLCQQSILDLITQPVKQKIQ